jgi:hypothetical protein
MVAHHLPRLAVQRADQSAVAVAPAGHAMTYAYGGANRARDRVCRISGVASILKQSGAGRRPLLIRLPNKSSLAAMFVTGKPVRPS